MSLRRQKEEKEQMTKKNDLRMKNITWSIERHEQFNANTHLCSLQLFNLAPRKVL